MADVEPPAARQLVLDSDLHLPRGFRSYPWLEFPDDRNCGRYIAAPQGTRERWIVDQYLLLAAPIKPRYIECKRIGNTGIEEANVSAHDPVLLLVRRIHDAKARRKAQFVGRVRLTLVSQSQADPDVAAESPFVLSERREKPL